MNTYLQQSGRLGQRKSMGIALIEAMMALVVVMAAVVGVLWFNSTVLGASASSRVASAAMLAAQAKLEELRNHEYTTLGAGNDNLAFESPGFVGAAPVAINRCWTVANIQHGGAAVPNILRVIVAAVSAGRSCDTADTTAEARLVSLLAKTDPRISAQNTVSSAAADGKGKLVNGYTPPTAPTTAPSGFKLVKEGDAVVAIMPPNGGPALVAADGGPLKYATINGNIIFDGSRSAADFAKLQVRIEGNALCRTYYPGFEPSSPNSTSPPSISGGGVTLGYVQYSCVVSEGWRRSIIVLTGNLTEKSCVGYPNMQPEDVVDVDYLESAGRQYVGRKAGASAGAWEWQGIKGASDGSAEIGSVCANGDSCWLSTDVNSARGWVPGGHHYFVMPKTGGLCADRMTEAFRAIDNASAGQSSVPTSLFQNYLFRNPHKVYCTNDKAYTNSLPALPTSEEFTTSDCYSYTKASGFITQNASVTFDRNSIIFGSSSPYFAPCRAMGAFGNQGGGYVCGFPENVTTSITPYLSGYTFTPGSYAGLVPLNVPLDFVRKSFVVASAGGACPAATLSWKVGSPGTTCQGAVVESNQGSTVAVKATASGSYGNGTASFTCTSSGWGSPIASPAATCDPTTSVPVLAKCDVEVSGANQYEKIKSVENTASVTIDGIACTVKKDSYTCKKSAVEENTTLTITHVFKGVTTSKSQAVKASDIKSGTCAYSPVNFP